mmetsp:Transcript_4956/g.17965  ORF Transcript_4956/g.17965 Transcript_4956/m.17965 type:complete len:201 (-) Transcript_4956:595-1197(-)
MCAPSRQVPGAMASSAKRSARVSTPASAPTSSRTLPTRQKRSRAAASSSTRSTPPARLASCMLGGSTGVRCCGTVADLELDTGVECRGGQGNALGVRRRAAQPAREAAVGVEVPLGGRKHAARLHAGERRVAAARLQPHPVHQQAARHFAPGDALAVAQRQGAVTQRLLVAGDARQVGNARSQPQPRADGRAVGAESRTR